jgi:PAS domain S-box-containing protein
MSPENPAETHEDTLHSFVASPVAVIGLDDRNNVDLWNPAAAALFGWPPDEIAGKPLPLALEALGHIGGGSTTVTITARTGRRFSVESRAGRRGSGGRVIVATALSSATTQRREPQPEFEAKPGKRFRELLAAIPDAIVEVSSEGHILLFNRATEQLFGYTRGELLGKNVDSLLPGGIAGRRGEAAGQWWARPFRRAMGRGSVLQGLRKDGSSFPLEIGLNPVRVAGELRVTAVIRDVTSRENAGEAERVNTSNNEFLAAISRELRAPLHTILGFSELLQEEFEGPLNAKQTRFVGQVHQDALQMLDLVNNIVDVNATDPNRENLDAVEIITEITTAAEARGFAIDSCIGDRLPVFADRVRLRQIVGTLVDHAIQSSPAGATIRLEGSASDRNSVQITVTHEGPAISGLALASLKRLVAMQGGEVHVESGRSTFTVPAPKPGRF